MVKSIWHFGGEALDRENHLMNILEGRGLSKKKNGVK
jgi:hypothetical protein